MVAGAAGWMLDRDIARAEATATVDAMIGELDPLPDELATVIRMRAARFR